MSESISPGAESQSKNRKLSTKAKLGMLAATAALATSSVSASGCAEKPHYNDKAEGIESVVSDPEMVKVKEMTDGPKQTMRVVEWGTTSKLSLIHI